MDPIMGRRANVNPPLTINGSNMGYNAASLREDDDAAVQADETDIEGSQRGKKKRKTGTDSKNELINFLKQKWNDDKEAEGIIRAENQAAREKHLDLMERNTEASCSIAESFKIMAEGRN
jgi:hypothetical protein